MSLSYGQSLAQSLTIDEMRTLHRHALTEAEAKKTELKLVLASRYRELVGSSDEVLDMQRDAQRMEEWVLKLPTLMDEWIMAVTKQDTFVPLDWHSKKEDDISNDDDIHYRYRDPCFLGAAPRRIHASLDESDVLSAAISLIQTFQCIAQYTNRYPLANLFQDHPYIHYPHLKSTKDNSTQEEDAQQLLTQIQMIYLHLQTMPLRIIQKAKYLLSRPSMKQDDCSNVVRSLASIHLLNIPNLKDDESHLKSHHSWMDVYFESKAKLIQVLLEDLSSKEDGGKGDNKNTTSISVKESHAYSSIQNMTTESSEKVISQILTMLQYDIILFPYQIFHLRKIPTEHNHQNKDIEFILSLMPTNMDEVQLKSKVSNFLASYLPMVRSKVKTILVAMAGTTASRLGHFRQVLYDKTDGGDCLASLSTTVCSWDDAIQIIDTKLIARALDGATSTSASVASSNGSYSLAPRKFSLWNTLFSGTFSSLVNSILTTSFHSVHRQVISTVRSSLANAPPFRDILPHEAYRNTLRITMELDNALKNVSDDAHDLLVHAEEKEESVLRLKQSLYVQTCQIMGRLLNELRLMLSKTSQTDDGTKELLVGRLCHLLKFRLASLPILLDPDSSPAAIAFKTGGRVGMISILELQSAFDVADMDDDGIISFDESLEAMEAAFSGTHYHGGDIMKETMLISPNGKSDTVSQLQTTFTALELALLSAQGLRHEAHGPNSALGIVKRLLDDLIKTSFSRWAEVLLTPAKQKHRHALEEFFHVSSTVSEADWKRLHLSVPASNSDTLNLATKDLTCNGSSKHYLSSIGSVSSFHIDYFMSIAIDLNRSFCPNDTISPFSDLDIDSSLLRTLRISVLEQSMISLITNLTFVAMTPSFQSKIESFTPASLVHLYMDVEFLYRCYFKRNHLLSNTSSFSSDNLFQQMDQVFSELRRNIKFSLEKSGVDIDDYKSVIESRCESVFNSCSMFFSDLLGNDESKILSGLESLPMSNNGDNIPLITNPLPSSCRFSLLPIQTGQTVQELELLYNLENERSGKTEIQSKVSSASAAASAVSSSFGYISSLLKKK